jgi:flagellar hook-basal body complex protein FliE
MQGAISAINAVSTMIQGSVGLGEAAASGTSRQAAPFSGLFRDAVGQIQSLEDQAHTAVEGLMTGAGVDVHQAMIATQKAEMAFELALSVRNKAVQAYQQVMSMQF